jgi:hypothetical protein
MDCDASSRYGYRRRNSAVAGRTDIAKIVSIPGVEYPNWSSVFQGFESVMLSALQACLRSIGNGEAIIGFAIGYAAVWFLSRPVTGFSRGAVGFGALILLALAAQALAFLMSYPFPKPFDVWEYILGGPARPWFKAWTALVPASLIIGHGVQILLARIGSTTTRISSETT